MPVVSVLLPVYNGADFVEEAISSVLSQSLKNFELIIRDDRSTDQSRNIIRKFTDKRIVAAENDANLGLFGNLNTCLALASGEFVHLFSQDDVMHADCLKSQLASLRTYKAAGMVYCGVRDIDRNGRVLGDSSQDKTSEFIDRDLYRLLSAHCGSLPASISTVMIRRKALDEVGKFNSNMKVAGDYELYNRISDRYSIIRNREILMDVRAHKSQLTNAATSGLWYIKEDISMMDWYRQRLSVKDWEAVRASRVRNRAVTYWAWIARQLLEGRIILAVRGFLAMSKGYNPFVALYYYCLSIGGRVSKALSRSSAAGPTR
jgi:glycosyltransferase involved in cell wall biosynthesis